jgi:hypothetical protein
MTMLDETRERFLNAMLARVPLERIAEIHFFQPMRQGGVESGVAVIAEGNAEREEGRALLSGQISDVESSDGPLAPENSIQDSPPFLPAPVSPLPSRYTIHTARYRLALKGPERGKWEMSVVAEADAPLLTVDAVVRGVQRRSGDVEEATRMTQDELLAVLGRRSDSAA